ncbi:FIST N-terminal domain-containing protein [Chitinivorax sp. B]|uniref:FIST signal transduction protein n=1 Tax=Chitinivorax sp. B TaxID=2502235 RepID=UPI0010F9173D|nr:FIST N-terminal domain-containing protein [Chitinivorax sp. B]
MQARSVYTFTPEPYRAGLEIGEALRDIQPEVVFLFCTIHYGQSAELVEGLYDALENDRLVVIGNSGDGIYETRRASNTGVTALALNSGGEVQWQVVYASNLGIDPAAATQRALAALQDSRPGESPALLFLSADFHADASEIERELLKHVAVPVVGGFAADDNRMLTCFLFANRQLLQDAIVLLGAYGPIRYAIRVANTLSPIGQPGLVNDACGTNVNTIDGLSAMDFIERETGKPVLQTDRGVVSLMVINPTDPAQRRIRSIVPDFSEENGHLGLYGGIEQGQTVQVCLASPEALIQEVYAVADQAKSLAFTPQAALIVSCGGRKTLLGAQVEHEIRALSQAFPDGLPLAGYPSFGEIGPLPLADGYTRSLFHNMSYVLLLLG